MKLIDSKLSHLIIERHKVDSGELFFLKDIIIAEFDEGVHIDFNSSQEHIHHIIDFYGHVRPYGYICNRINDYSISPQDYPKFNKVLANLAIYGIVNKNYLDSINYNIEKQFCNKPYKGFDDLYSAFNQVSIFVNKTKTEKINKILIL